MYVGKVIAKQGFLLGGVKIHKTSKMDTREDCLRLCKTYVSVNLNAGRFPEIHSIREVE